MTAREIEAAAARLRELQVEAAANLALATIAFGLAVAASLVLPPLAIPLLVGGMAATVLGLRSFLRRAFLLDDLAGQKDAYAIADVRRQAARDHRRRD